MGSLRVGVIGASSFLGEQVLVSLLATGCEVIAYSRTPSDSRDDRLQWRLLPGGPESAKDDACERIDLWICAAPIWVLAEHFGFLAASGVRRLVAVSSTSRFTKDGSEDPAERELASRLAKAEEDLRVWAYSHQIEWNILRPTLIYGFGRDQNVAEISRFIKRFRFFPVFGRAEGLRQPVHVLDVANACTSVLLKSELRDRQFDISGGERITYREMCVRIFDAMSTPPRFLTIPLWLFRIGVSFVRLLPRYKKWSVGMAVRMNQDLVFDHSAASREFGYSPRSFVLGPDDVLR